MAPDKNVYIELLSVLFSFGQSILAREPELAFSGPLHILVSERTEFMRGKTSNMVTYITVSVHLRFHRDQQGALISKT